jgi:hypothetical protein
VRIAVLLFVVGCIQPPPDEPFPPPPPDNGWTGPSGDPVDSCGDLCGSDVCARDGSCYPADLIRMVHARWTIDGAPASSETCATHPDLHIAFTDGSGQYRLGFAPVPCRNGLFTVDKLPDVYTRVELGVAGQELTASAPFDEAGDAMLDLP